jgi:hypothetical protein
MNKSNLSVLAVCFLIQSLASANPMAPVKPLDAAVGVNQSYAVQGPLRDVADAGNVRRGGVWRHHH